MINVEQSIKQQRIKRNIIAIVAKIRVAFMIEVNIPRPPTSNNLLYSNIKVLAAFT